MDRPRLSWLSGLFPGALVIALAYFLLHLMTSTRYGYFRDALYYLACSEHLDLGYVDHPPLIVLIGWVTRYTLGTSLPALIFWPALAGAGRILLSAALARALGAQHFGIAFAAIVTSLVPVWFVIDHQFAMNAFEPLFWLGCALVLVRMIQTENPKLWIAFGILTGLGMENKYSMAVFAFALLAGILLTPQRKILFTRWLFAGGGVALLILLPNLLWNIQHHWPFLELMHNIRVSGKDVTLSPTEFLAQQVLIAGPATLPIWLAGSPDVSLLKRTPRLSRVGLRVHHHYSVFHPGPRKELLPGARVWNCFRRRRGRYRAMVVIKLDERAPQPSSCDQGPVRVMAYRRHTSYPARGSPSTSCG